MALSYALVAVLAIAGYEAYRTMSNGSETDAAKQSARAAIIIATLIVALPLGAVLGAFTVSALAENIVTGVFLLTGSVTIVAVIGLGLYTVAEGKIPASLRRYTIS